MSEPIGAIVLAAGQGSRFRQVAGAGRTNCWRIVLAEMALFVR